MAHPLTHLINLSLQCGIIPTELKIARVIPIFKNGDAKEIKNYRPISILSSISKIYEKVIFVRLQNFFDKHNLLSKCQYGFRPGFSTDMAISILQENITKAIDEKEHIIGIFLDLSKAFDTVNHEILLSKLEYYGVRGNAYNLIKSYLNERTQFVEYNNVRSEEENVTCGVPQGSILGPLLFLIYINDLANVSQLLNVIMFADDTTLFINDKCLNYLENTVNVEITKISEWMNINKLSINLQKTNAMLFGPKNYNQVNPSVSINSKEINFVEHTKFLGVILDRNLNWKNHILYISSKIAKGIGIINKIKYKVNKGTLLTLYYTFVYPYLIYGNIIWGNAAQSHLSKLLILQKRIVRIISQVGFTEHTLNLFTELNILNINEIHKYSILLFMYKHFKHLLPNQFDDFFPINTHDRRYEIRTQPHYIIPRCRTNLRQRTICYIGPYLFNDLLNYCKKYSLDIAIVSFPHFKKLFGIS